MDLEEEDWELIGGTLLPLMDRFDVQEPDLDDPFDLYRALVQLRSRMVTGAAPYRHETNKGRLYAYLEEKIKEPERLDEAQDRLSLLNPRKRKNPVRDDEKKALEAYLKGDYSQAPSLDSFFAGADQGDDYDYDPMTQEYRPDTVGALFPREGKLKQPDTWDPERIPEALDAYALVTRVGQPMVPEDEAVGAQPLSSAASIDYLVGAMGLSVNEAKKVLKEMKRSAEGRKSRTGQRTAMQPSSAMCKLYRSRKLPYHPPSEIVERAGNKAVVVLMGPEGEPRPRVMSWRRGVHMDCDIVADAPKMLFEALSRALQSALFWVAEKPGRKKSNTIYVGHVGGGGLYKVWAPGQPLTLQQVAENLKKSKASGYAISVRAAQAQRDREAYDKALADTFGTRLPSAGVKTVGKRLVESLQREEEKAARPPRKSRGRRSRTRRPEPQEVLQVEEEVEALVLEPEEPEAPGSALMEAVSLKGILTKENPSVSSLFEAATGTKLRPHEEAIRSLFGVE